MEKITDLRRKIEQRRSEIAISPLADLRINTSKDDVLKHAIDKIAKEIIYPIIADSALSDEELIIKLKELVSCDSNIVVDIKLDLPKDSYNQKGVNIVESILTKKNSKTRKMPVEQLRSGRYVQVKFTSPGIEKEVFFLSSLRYPLTTVAEGKWSFTSSFCRYYWVLDLSRHLAYVFLVNELYKFTRKNPEFSIYIILKHIHDTVFAVGSEQERDLINTKLNEYKIGELDCNITNRLLYSEIIPLLDPEHVKQGFKINHLYPKRNKQNLFLFKALNKQAPWSIQETFYIPLLRYMMILDEEIEADEKRKSYVATTYATAYMTKKNIPLKVQNAMQSSYFNKWFRYVEYDEQCDLEKMKLIEKEFISFACKIGLPLRQDVDIRFRFLGKHRAAGLYFPEMRSLCVDLRYPSALAHELGHMIDYELSPSNISSFSAAYSFRPIIDRYKELMGNIISKLDKQDPQRIRWEGNTKYNRGYYFTPTEIFARCFEIYLYRIKKIESSLIDECNEIYYPVDSEFEESIERYFDELFKFYNLLAEIPEEEFKEIDIIETNSFLSNVSQKASSIVFNTTEAGQLAFF